MASKYTMHICKLPHPATLMGRGKPISRTLYNLATEANFSDTLSDYAVCVYYKKRIVGVFLFDFYERSTGSKYKGKKVLYTGGTGLIPSLQGRGLASKMWQMAIKKFQPDVIDTYVVSFAGLALAKKMKKLNPKIKFKIERARNLDW